MYYYWDPINWAILIPFMPCVNQQSYALNCDNPNKRMKHESLANVDISTYVENPSLIGKIMCEAITVALSYSCSQYVRIHKMKKYINSWIIFLHLQLMQCAIGLIDLRIMYSFYDITIIILLTEPKVFFSCSQIDSENDEWSADVNYSPEPGSFSTLQKRK